MLWIGFVDIRDAVIDYERTWKERTEIQACKIVGWIGISSIKFFNWKIRYGKVNEHNAKIPRDHWLEAQERDR